MVTDVETGARTESVRLKLSPEMVARLGRLAGSHGMPASTIAAYGLAAWVNQQENALKLSRLAAVEMARALQGSLVDADKALGSAMPEIVASMTRAMSAAGGGEAAPTK